ncbi:MAG: MoaD/ThiS family protein [Desulfobacteraceae bacterium]|nr:MAG: MoaD/ThiS family protein [Desulfobacteraceae bacterium]
MAKYLEKIVWHLKKGVTDMFIKVRGYIFLKRYTDHLPPQGEFQIPEGTTVAAVLNQLKVPPEMEKVVFVNGRHRTENYILQPGDILVLFPPLEGG